MDVIAQPEVVRIQGNRLPIPSLNVIGIRKIEDTMVDPHSSSKIFDS